MCHAPDEYNIPLVVLDTLCDVNPRFGKSPFLTASADWRDEVIVLYAAAKPVTSFLGKMVRLHFVTNAHDCLCLLVKRHDKNPVCITMILHYLFLSLVLS